MRGRLLVLVLLLAALPAAPAGAAPQDDAGSGGDAGDTFETATRIEPRGRYEGRLDPEAGDRDDFYKFHLPEGAFLSILVGLSAPTADPVMFLDPNGAPLDVGSQVSGVGATHSAAFTSELFQVRLALHRAPVAGDYRLHLRSELFHLEDYGICFMNCEDPQEAPIDMIFGGSLKTTRTRVLLVPPAHGDLGNPFGPTVLDYLDATLRGIHGWVDALHAFADDHPLYAYLKEITVEIEVFDGVSPVDPAGYEVIIGYVAAGPVFRGVAANVLDPQAILDEVGIGDDVRFSGRVIALSLFGGAPRAGQVMWDFPEVTDLEIVTLHEFGHTFGLGHTTTWHPELGPDLMNSPAPFVYGDGWPLGDGGERTSMVCLSSLNLYGMAHLYRWIPSGRWVPSYGSVWLPPEIPYRWYCTSS